MTKHDTQPIELIKTMTGSHRRVVVGYAYRCTRCGQIFPNLKDREKAIFHECKGPK